MPTTLDVPQMPRRNASRVIRPRAAGDDSGFAIGGAGVVHRDPGSDRRSAGNR
ncbi:hypothetical protein [Micromonospora costi]|uniref:hypothetical protein n=1 Tax=Micromonospora costi TaxID=1530042 RepID=UPI001319D8FA|nr:hypothetical protein [Micromonospora costi]